ncbi:MAG: phosphatidylserine synthase [Acidobacteriaceae bacterium]|nr:phosphatidylserine synthase [Acidobacteriaceae bacterium]
MKLLIQPGDGIGALVKAINKAKKTVEIVIFRFDLAEVEHALESAVERGVFVHALIASINRGGEKNLRKLEMRLLASGVTVARTADDLIRYHGKMAIIDRKELFLLAFNFTHLDTERSRSFGLITKNPTLVQEAVKLFDADTKRQTYSAGSPKFLVSPVNARKQLAKFIKGAKKELLIYDLKISDRGLVRLLEERAKSGVSVRIIGHMARKSNLADVRELSRLRLHARSIIRDRTQAFLGSQSLRQLELDARREIGIIFRDGKAISAMVRTFEEDWKTARTNVKAVAAELEEPVAHAAKKVAKAVSKQLPVAPVLEQVVKDVVANRIDVDIDHEEVVDTVKDAVKDAVRDAVEDTFKNVVTKVAEEAGTGK